MFFQRHFKSHTVGGSVYVIKQSFTNVKTVEELFSPRFLKESHLIEGITLHSDLLLL